MPILIVAVMYFVVEGYVLFWAAEQIGIFQVFLVLGATALIGFYIARSEGISAFNRANQAFIRGESPHAEMLDGIVLLICGIILIIPGLLSDLLVLPLLIPAFRKIIVRRMSTQMPRPGMPKSPFSNQMNNPDFNDGQEYQASAERQGPFTFYRFFMSCNFSNQKPQQEMRKGDVFIKDHKDEIIDVTAHPIEPEDKNGSGAENTDKNK